MSVHPASIARPFGVTGVVSNEAAGNEGSADLNDDGDRVHAATSVRRLFGLAVNLAGTRAPFSFASSRNGNMRHAGIALEMFQPDTVETGAPIASATATVPSRLSMNSLTVMFETLRKT